MECTVNFQAEELLQSQSPKAPFITIYEKDSNTSICYALTNHGNEPLVQDQIILHSREDLSDV